MAKIGNEAKLVLKLANERMGVRFTQLDNEQRRHSSSWMQGYEQCLHDYNGVLSAVQAELEAK